MSIRERSTLGAFVNAGNLIENIIGYLGTAFIMKNKTLGWEWVYYFWGIIAIVWYLLFLLVCYSKPSQHPFISLQEAQMLEKEIGAI